MTGCRFATSLLALWLVIPGLFSFAGAEATPSLAAEAEPGLGTGQPPRWRLGWGPLGGYDFKRESGGGRLFLDAEGRIAMPQFGLLDVHLEGALDRDRLGSGSALGMYAKLPYVRVGLERDLDDHRFDVTLSVQGAVRRGGMFHRGERLRIDYTPARRRVQLGFVFNTPWMRYRATRPYRIAVDLPKGAAPAPIAADATLVDTDELARVEHAIEWLDRLLTPNLEPKGFHSPQGWRAFARELGDIQGHVRLPGHSFAGEDSAYHACLELAFARAAGGDPAAGRELAAAAEGIIFRDLLVPFNRQFARPRRPAGLGGLVRMAQEHFDQVVRDREPRLDEVNALAARETFRRVAARIDATARAARRRWGSSLAWLPLNYGLRPGQYDSQDEIESVAGQVLGESFSQANSIGYILNDQFYYELRNTIRETRQYHVLWIHDFRGRNEHKHPDRIAWSQATEGYIEAFAEAVREMDRGARRELPIFIVFLDEHYYQVNESRRLITLLEHLSSARPPKLKDAPLGARLSQALLRLQDLVRNSAALRERGDDYVRRRLRVQVHVTYPLDPAYAGDILMRDHRKLAFCDVSEEDPASGRGLFTGEGVGEHYQGPHWEDRTLVVRGPELLRLKAAARRLLLGQGFEEGEIPLALRPRAGAENYAAACDSLRRRGWNADLLMTMNDTGWGPKQATALKAVLYNLMPRGACMIAPDSLWASDFWAAMFVSAALRGCRAYVIAPAREHAPSNALPTMGLMHETLTVLLRASQRLAPDLARSGGELHVGLYTRESDVSDMRALLRALLEGTSGVAPSLQAFRLHPDVIRALQAEYDTLQSDYPGPVHPLRGEDPGKATAKDPGKPQIHMKAQFFTSAEGLDILARPEWGPVLARYLAVRRHQTATPDADVEGLSPALLGIPGASGSAPSDVFTVYRDSLATTAPQAAGRIFYLATVGSHNQDRRSMLLDGEVLVAVSGPAALLTAVDFASLLATATWPRSVEELDAHFPESGGLIKQIRRWMKNLI
jgi:hypothetical protein